MEQKVAKILVLGSPASTRLFDTKINATYNQNYEVKQVRDFYTLPHLLGKFAESKKFGELFSDDKILEYYSWNFERGGFWGKVKAFQPDIIIYDFISDLYFGNLRLPSKVRITNNFRILHNRAVNATTIAGDSDENIDDLKKDIFEFEDRLKEYVPNVKVIYNASKLATQMSKNDTVTGDLDASLYKLPTSRVNRINKRIDEVESWLKSKGKLTLHYSNEYNAAEQNFVTGQNWYYFYNQNYYTDTEIQLQFILQKLGFRLSIGRITMDDLISSETVTDEVVLLDIPSKHTDLRVFRSNKIARKKALELAKLDYVLHGNAGHNYRFIKRKKLKTPYEKFEDVHYRLIAPKEEKQYWDNRILVRMFGFSLPYRTSIIDRNFRRDFLSLKDSVAKNTYILEIGDINLIAGSFYSNTENFPDYEQQIQRLVDHIVADLNVPDENVVYYGTSRGGTGALINGISNNKKVLVADPVIDDTAWLKDNDIHFVEGVRLVDLTDKVNRQLADYQGDPSNIIVMASSNIGLTFSAHLRLLREKFTLIDIAMDVTEHGPFNGKTVPLQLSFINYLLSKSDYRIIKDFDGDIEVTLQKKHLVNQSIDLAGTHQFKVLDATDLPSETIEWVINQGFRPVTDSSSNVLRFEK